MSLRRTWVVCLSTGVALIGAMPTGQAADAPVKVLKRAAAVAVEVKVQAVAADEAAAPAEKPKAENKDEKRKEADKKAEAAAVAAEMAVEAVDLNDVAAPLRALLGGVVAPAAMPAAVDVQLQNNAMIAQFQTQLRPKYAAELEFVRLVFPDLPKEVRPKVRAAADAALTIAAKQAANQNGAQIQINGVARGKSAEPRKTIRDGISKALKENLTEEQMALYNDEATKRAHNLQQATIRGVIARLDAQLYLTSEQRELISNSMASKWQDGWEKWLEMTRLYGDRYYPQVPDNLVEPHLKAEQKTVWRTLQKVDFNWFNGEQGLDLDSDGWWGIGPAKADAGAANMPAQGVIQIFRAGF